MGNRRKFTGMSRDALKRYIPALCLAVLFCIFAAILLRMITLDPGSGANAAAMNIGPGGQRDLAVLGESGIFPQGRINKSSLDLPEFNPRYTSKTKPSHLLAGTGIMVDGRQADSYILPDPVDFGLGKDYSLLEGITTFRGNNFRDSGAFGTADLEDESFVGLWSLSIGNLQAPDGEIWTGTGWTGQPLIARWPEDTRKAMNLEHWAKNTPNLVEVIYPAMDGKIYFAELTTGTPTRDPIDMGYTFKGTGALDPRGYPILYLGAGYNSSKGTARAFALSLIDGKILYEFGDNDTFSLRSGLSYFDSSPLIDAATDQLIYPGENGILYIIKLNSKFSGGTVSIDPERTVKWRYSGVRSGGQYWPGIESSPVIWRGHIFLADNGGLLMCVDLSTLETVWVHDTLDDTNCTPVLELENGHPYLYISTSFHAGWRASEKSSASIPIWKIDAVTGEAVWETSYDCYTVSGVSGGVQGTIAVGKQGLGGLIFVSVARTPSADTGRLVALDKYTGEEVWVLDTQVYSWSSPVAVYDSDGKGYIIYGTSGGYIYLLDGLTKQKLDSVDLGGNIESTPAVFENTVVVGTRSQLIYGLNMG